MNPAWDEASYDALADIWVRITPAERDRVEAAVNRINRELRDEPEYQGESRENNTRVYIASPLTVWYRVIDGRARIFQVHHTPSRRG